MGRYIKGLIDEDLALSTLGPDVVIRQTFTETVNERCLVSSVKATYSLSGFTIGDNKGPVQVGIAHSDYSLAEIQAFVDRVDSWDEGNLVEREVTGRKIRQIGVFSLDNSGGVGSNSVLNDGKPIRTKLNWILNQGQTLQIWARNLGTAALTTTDPNVNMQGQANLFPR